MGFLNFSSSAQNKPSADNDGRVVKINQQQPSLNGPSQVITAKAAESANPDTPLPNSHSTNTRLPPVNQEQTSDPISKQNRFILRFSLRNQSFVRSHDHKPSLTPEESNKRIDASGTPTTSSASGRRAKKDALILRTLILGPQVTAASPKVTRLVAKPRLSKIKSQLLEPKSANKLIAELKALPVADSTGPGVNAPASPPKAGIPIHAVCLELTDAEEDESHFSRLAVDESSNLSVSPSQKTKVANVANASIEAIENLLRDMHVVSLITEPDLGLGQPGDGNGLLAGAVPTAETVIKGAQQITPQLMALGYATSQAIYPDHSGVHPPTDRMSVLTYWWGLELCLPEPSIVYLSNAHSISSSVMNFLTAVSIVSNGVREILPFIRYISQFIDFEFSAIEGQDKGNGVVCAATWVMPAAMIPRPWDFPPAPPAAAVVGGLAPASGPSGVGKPKSEDSTNVQPKTATEPDVPLPARSLPDVVIDAPNIDGTEVKSLSTSGPATSTSPAPGVSRD